MRPLRFSSRATSPWRLLPRPVVRGLGECLGEQSSEYDFLAQLALHFDVDRKAAERMLRESLQSGHVIRQENRDEWPDSEQTLAQINTDGGMEKR